jgi:8-oxo-dGTP pyrophosphatase MutT (NUDIX family)
MNHSNFTSLISEALRHLHLQDATNAVAVVQHGDKWLLGLSASRDDREHKWCFPGGRIKGNEGALNTARREAKEEAGVKCSTTSNDLCLPKDKKTVFVHCKASSADLDEPNREFIIFGWFTIRQMKGLKLHNNVLQVIDKFKRMH